MLYNESRVGLFQAGRDDLRNTRERIKEEALKLFLEKGYGKTTIAEIERAAGLAPRAGGFYRHFPSKSELAVEIGRTSIIETREDLGFAGTFPLGDTRAELILIARGYMKTAERQAPFAKLIFELQHLSEIKELEISVSENLLEEFVAWLRGKPYGRTMSDVELTMLAMNVFGGWLFYLSKRERHQIMGLNDETMLANWADMWAEILDRE